MSFYLGHVSTIIPKETAFVRKPQRTKLINNNTIIQFASQTGSHCFLCSDNNLYISNNGNLTRFGSLQFESIKSGGNFFLGKTIDGKMASWGSFSNSQLGRGANQTNSKFPTIIKDPLIQNVCDYACGYYHSLVLLENNDLIGFGRNSFGQIGSDNTSSKTKPHVMAKSVENIYCNHSEGTMLKKTDGQFYCAGYNSSGQLSNDKMSNALTLEKVIMPKNTVMKDLVVGCWHSLYLSDQGKLYGSGDLGEILMNQNCKTFKEIPFFKDKIINKIYGSYEHSLAISETGQIYFWGKSATRTMSQGDISSTQPYCFKSLAQQNWEFHLGYHGEILIVEKDDISQEFLYLYQSRFLTDSKISGIPVHKSFLELRIGKNIDHIQEILNQNSITKEQIKILLEWVYGKHTFQSPVLKKILQLLGISDLKNNTLLMSLKKWFKDSDSKNFKLLVSVDDEIDDEDEDDEEEYYEEIPVHKIILAARCGLFREMFKNLNQDLSKVKDYSNKSPESLEIFFKFLYTNKLELTADDDPELVVEELGDCQEYYQLSSSSFINSEIQKIKRNYNLL